MDIIYYGNDWENSNNPRINKLRVINIHEENYNLLLTFSWPQWYIQHTEVMSAFEENQQRCRPNYSVYNVVFIDEFITKMYWLFFRRLFKLQNDDKYFFNIILTSHAMLHICKLEVLDDICMMNFKTLYDTEHWEHVPSLGGRWRPIFRNFQK